MARISIITPVYNVRDFIVTCIDSFVFQSMDDLEVIFVDDHGQDDSIALAKKYLEEYVGNIKFRFIATESNSGPAAARNLGLGKATGEYVAFVDSDDWIEPQFCELLYKAASGNRADIALCDISLDNVSDGTSEVKKNPSVHNGEFTPKNRRKFLKSFTSYFTTYIYRREFLEENAIRFPDTRSAEDSCFLTCCLIAARRIASVRQAMYHYMIRSTSLSISSDSGRYRQKLESFSRMLEYARSRDLYDANRDELDFIYIKKAFLISVFTYIRNTEKPQKEEIVSIARELEKNVPQFRNNRYLRGDLKIRTLSSLIEKHPKIAMSVISTYLKKSKKML